MIVSWRPSWAMEQDPTSKQTNIFEKIMGRDSDLTEVTQTAISVTLGQNIRATVSQVDVL
jgi:hypothetical protein